MLSRAEQALLDSIPGESVPRMKTAPHQPAREAPVRYGSAFFLEGAKPPPRTHRRGLALWVDHTRGAADSTSSSSSSSSPSSSHVKWATLDEVRAERAVRATAAAAIVKVGFWRQHEKASDYRRDDVVFEEVCFVPPGKTYAEVEAEEDARDEAKRAAEFAMPWPVATDGEGKWLDQKAFRKRLVAVEALKTTHKERTFGFSACRLCGRANGSEEYSRDGFAWPSGYAHYLHSHRVVAPDDFVAMIMRQA